MRNMGICCIASEKGKKIVNKCIDNNIEINTLKLEKLLILVHGKMLSMYQKPFFNENVIATKHGLMIKEVDRDFIRYVFRCNEKLVEYICLLDDEEEVVNSVLREYTNRDGLDLNSVIELKVLSEICYEEGKKNIVPNELIKEVFTRYQFSHLDVVKNSDESFQKKLRNNFKNIKK